MTTTTYDIYQLDSPSVWSRIYKDQSFRAAESILRVELSHPSQKGKWKVVRVETQVQEFEETLEKFQTAITITKGWSGPSTYSILATRGEADCRLSGYIQPDGSFEASGNAWYPAGIIDEELLQVVLDEANCLEYEGAGEA